MTINRCLCFLLPKFPDYASNSSRSLAAEEVNRANRLYVQTAIEGGNEMSDRSQRIKLFLPFVLVLFFITTGALFILMMEDAPVWAASRADSIHADAVIEKADALDSKYAREHWKYGWKGSKYGYSSKLVDCAGFCRNVYAALGAPTGHWYTRHGRVVHCDRLTSAGFRYWNIGGDDGMKISDAAKGGHIRKGDIVGYRYKGDDGSRTSLATHTELFAGKVKDGKYLFYDYGPSFVKKGTGKHWRRDRRIGCVIRFGRIDYSSSYNGSSRGSRSADREDKSKKEDSKRNTQNQNTQKQNQTQNMKQNNETDLEQNVEQNIPQKTETADANYDVDGGDALETDDIPEEPAAEENISADSYDSQAENNLPAESRAVKNITEELSPDPDTARSAGNMAMLQELPRQMLRKSFTVSYDAAPGIMLEDRNYKSRYLWEQVAAGSSPRGCTMTDERTQSAADGWYCSRDLMIDGKYIPAGCVFSSAYLKKIIVSTDLHLTAAGCTAGEAAEEGAKLR